MKERKSPRPRTELEKAREHFESWRRTKEHTRSPIPEALWQEAVGLASAHSIYEISKALHLDYSLLKRRVQRNKDLSESPADPATAFVELSLSAAMPISECIIELERSDGMRMRMILKGAVNHQLVDLATAFWNGV